MSSFKKANKQGGKAWGQIQGAAHDSGDMLQGSPNMGSFGGNAFGKAFDDIGAEFGRASKDPWKTASLALAHPYVAGAAGTMVPGAGLLFPFAMARTLQNYRESGGGTGIWHKWNRQLDPTYAKNYREDKADARREAEQAALAQRQSMMQGGIGGGGAGANAEIDRYNQILAQFAAQQQQLRSTGMQGDIETIAMLMRLIGGGGG